MKTHSALSHLRGPQEVRKPSKTDRQVEPRKFLFFFNTSLEHKTQELDPNLIAVTLQFILSVT